MPQHTYVPLVCPTCGNILQVVDALYRCSLNHCYTGQQLDDALVLQLRQTLQRTIRQVEQSQHLAEWMAQRSLLISVPTTTALLESAHLLAKQLLIRVTSTTE